MLEEIGSPDNVPAFIERVKRKEVVASGLGHRIYRNVDPRSKIIQKCVAPSPSPCPFSLSNEPAETDAPFPPLASPRTPAGSPRTSLR